MRPLATRRGCLASRIHRGGARPGLGASGPGFQFVLSGLRHRHKPVTAGDRRHLQVKRGVSWMTALIQHRLVRLLAADDRHQRWCSFVILSEVTAEPALTGMKRLHACTPVLHL